MSALGSGEVFEGQLYGLGENRVWLDTHLGRLALDASLLGSVERLEAPASGTPATTLESQPGDRVRVETPGGWLYGRILARNGERITLLTENGGRITLDDPLIEPVGRDSAVVIK